MQIEKPLQRHGGRLEHDETYCGSCYGAETVFIVSLLCLLFLYFILLIISIHIKSLFLLGHNLARVSSDVN